VPGRQHVPEKRDPRCAAFCDLRRSPPAGRVIALNMTGRLQVTVKIRWCLYPSETLISDPPFEQFKLKI
jgi:hypothetical protein